MSFFAVPRAKRITVRIPLQETVAHSKEQFDNLLNKITTFSLQHFGTVTFEKMISMGNEYYLLLSGSTSGALLSYLNENKYNAAMFEMADQFTDVLTVDSIPMTTVSFTKRDVDKQLYKFHEEQRSGDGGGERKERQREDKG